MAPGFATLMNLGPSGDGEFVGPSSPDGGRRTYGGQVIAHTLRAAQLTVPGDRAIHSSHSYFLSAGDATKPMRLAVDRIRDGRSFSQREVVASQDGAEVMRSLVSFHAPEDGLAWPEPHRLETAAPTTTAPYTDYCDVIESVLREGERPWSGRDRPMDVRYVNPPTPLDGRPVTEPQRMWMRVHGPLPAASDLHEVAIAYLADLGMNPIILLPHGHSWRDDRVTEASLDHAMWFHRPARADEWLFCEQRVESTSGGRGLAAGRFFDGSGRLIATCRQEGLMRWRS